MPTVAIAPGAHRRVVGEAQAGRRPGADVADDPDGHVDLGEPVVGHAVPQQVGARAPADLQRDRPAARCHGQRQHLALDRLQRGRVVDASAVVVGPPVVDPQHDQPGPRVGGQHAAGQERGDGAVDEVEAHGAVVVGERHGPGVERGAAAQPTGVLADPFQPRLVVEDAPDGGAVGGVPAERERGAAGRGDEPEARGADGPQPLLDGARGEADEVVAVVGGPGQQGRAPGQRQELGGPVGGRQQLRPGWAGEVPDLGAVGGQAGRERAVRGEAGAETRGPLHLTRMATGPPPPPSPRGETRPVRLAGKPDVRQPRQVTVTVRSSVSTGLPAPSDGSSSLIRTV